MKFHVITLGCDKNTVDSERYVAELSAHGASPSGAEDAELIVINTCGFIDAAKQESIDAILEAVRFKESGRCVMVAAVGCMVERHKPELLEALPEVDLFLGTSESDQLVAAAGARGLLGDAPLLAHPGMRLYTGDLPHIRYLKISEGCDHGCAFCAIPLMRGRHRSFGTEELVREAQLLQLQGAKEVNLVAQDLAHYGRDVRDGQKLPELLRALLAETDIPWFRLLYIYSAGLTDAMLELLASEPRIVRYLDIPMQHASDSVLTRMRRPERKARQREKLQQIREMIAGVAIRTTVIVGFPGETEAEFSELLEFLEETPLERVGVFTYSPQEGTRAYEMADDVPDEVKRDRAERVEQLQRQITAERYDRMVGRVVRGIVDRAAGPGEPAQARIYAQADDVDGVTWVDSVAGPGSLIDVLLSGVSDDYDFQGEVVRIVAEGNAARQPSARRVLPLAPSAGSHSYGKPWPA